MSKSLVIMLCSAHTLLISPNSVVAYSLHIYQTTPIQFQVQDDCSLNILLDWTFFQQ